MSVDFFFNPHLEHRPCSFEQHYGKLERKYGGVVAQYKRATNWIKSWFTERYAAEREPLSGDFVVRALEIILSDQPIKQDVIEQLDEAIQLRQVESRHRWGQDYWSDKGHMHFSEQLLAVRMLFMAAMRRQRDKRPQNQTTKPRAVGDHGRRILDRMSPHIDHEVRYENLIECSTMLVLKRVPIDKTMIEDARNAAHEEEAFPKLPGKCSQSPTNSFRVVLVILETAYDYLTDVQTRRVDQPSVSETHVNSTDGIELRHQQIASEAQNEPDARAANGLNVLAPVFEPGSSLNGATCCDLTPHEVSVSKSSTQSKQQ